LRETVDYFVAILVARDPLAYLGGREKAPYRFINRKPSVHMKDSFFVHKTANFEIRKVSAFTCCSMRCCQFFPQEQMLIVRQRYYLKSFEDQCEYGIATGGQIHNFEGDWNQKAITLEGVEICIPAWYLIHRISKSTYPGYMSKYKFKTALFRTHMEIKGLSGRGLEPFK